jgi:hypothetical protein
MTVFSFSQWLTQAIAGLNEGEKCREKGFLTLPPDSDRNGNYVFAETPFNLSSQKGLLLMSVRRH